MALKSNPDHLDEDSDIEAIQESAKQAKRLFEALILKAVDLTDEYLQSLLDGKKGVTWTTHISSGSQKCPLVAPVLKDNDKIKVGCGYNSYYGFVQEDFFFQRDMKDNSLRVHERGYGYNPGSDYIVCADNRVLKAGYKHQEFVPTAGADGKLVYPRSFLNLEDYEEVQEHDPHFTRVLQQISQYV